MISVVVKAFEGPDGLLESGTTVDSTPWRNEGRLLNCRFIRPATDDEAAAFTSASSTRSVKTAGSTPKAKTRPSKTIAKQKGPQTRR
jgi:hypothetical protein